MSEYNCPKEDCEFQSDSLCGMSLHTNKHGELQFPTDDMFRSDLNNISSIIGGPPKKKHIKEYSEFSFHVYRRVFGGFNDVLEYFNFDKNVESSISKDDLKNELLRVSDELGRTPKYREMDELSKYSSTTYYKRFNNGWKGALNSIGLEVAGNPTGEDSPHWSGGNTKFYKSGAGELWRKAVFQRDEYTCQDCGDDGGGNLNAHHIKRRDEHPELELMVWNGVTLCRWCHAERHKGENVYEMLRARAKSLSRDSSTNSTQ